MADSKPLVKSITVSSGTAMYVGLLMLIFQQAGVPIQEAVVQEGFEVLGATAAWLINLIGRARAKKSLRLF